MKKTFAKSLSTKRHPKKHFFPEAVSDPEKSFLVSSLAEPPKLHLGWQPTSTVFRSRGPLFFNILDEIVTWQRLQPPVAGISGGLNGAVLGVRALSFAIVPTRLVYHGRLSTNNNVFPPVDLLVKRIEEFGEDPIGEAGMATAFSSHSNLVKQAEKLKAAMEQLLLRHSPISHNNNDPYDRCNKSQGSPALNFTVGVPVDGFNGIQLNSTRVVSSWCHGSIWCPHEPRHRRPNSNVMWSASPVDDNNTQDQQDKNTPNAKFMAAAIDQRQRLDVLRGPHTPLDWFVLHYDSHFCPPFLFKLSIEWIVCSSLFICRLVLRMRVMAACYGFTLVDLPIAQLLSHIPAAATPTQPKRPLHSTQPNGDASSSHHHSCLTNKPRKARLQSRNVHNNKWMMHQNNTNSHKSHRLITSVNDDYDNYAELNHYQHAQQQPSRQTTTESNIALQYRCLNHIAPVGSTLAYPFTNPSSSSWMSQWLSQWKPAQHRLLPFHPPWTVELTRSVNVCRAEKNTNNGKTKMFRFTSSKSETGCCSICEHNELQLYRELLMTLLTDDKIRLLLLCHHEEPLLSDTAAADSTGGGRGLSDSITPGWLLMERHGLLLVHITRRRVSCHSHYLQSKWTKNSTTESTPFVGSTSSNEDSRSVTWRSQTVSRGVRQVVYLTYKVASQFNFDCHLSDVYRNFG